MLTTLIVALTLGTPVLPTASSQDEALSCLPLTGATAQHLLCRLDRTDMYTFRPTFVDPASAQACWAQLDVLGQRVAMARRAGTPTFGTPTTSTPAPTAKSTFGINPLVTQGVLACTQRPF